MIISIHQPNFLPWLGYFHKIRMADVHVFLDDVQFTKNSYINRTRIKTPNGPYWLTVPVKVTLGMKINEVGISDRRWLEKACKTIECFYKKTPHFDFLYEELVMALSANYENLASMNIALIKKICDLLGLEKTFVCSSDFPSELKADDRLIELIKKIDGHTYISGAGGKNYQSDNKFEENSINLVYSDFKYPEYTQPWGEFVPGLSIIDYLFNADWKN